MGRRRRTLEEKRRIVELTLEPGASVARVAQAEGVNANQVFLWRRVYRNGELLQAGSTALLPVVIEAEGASCEAAAPDREAPLAVAVEASSAAPSGAIHIELPGCAP
jgi:transposase